MKALVKKMVNECDICKEEKVEIVAYPGILQFLPTPKST
jgi:hypothetical protein